MVHDQTNIRTLIPRCLSLTMGMFRAFSARGRFSTAIPAEPLRSWRTRSPSLCCGAMSSTSRTWAKLEFARVPKSGNDNGLRGDDAATAGRIRCCRSGKIEDCRCDGKKLCLRTNDSRERPIAGMSWGRNRHTRQRQAACDCL